MGEARRRAAVALSALGLRAELVDAGRGRDPTAWWCGLLDSADSPLACGMGKGRPEEARVGALFEAIEHYLTGPAGFDPAAVEPAAPARIAAGPCARTPPRCCWPGCPVGGWRACPIAGSAGDEGRSCRCSCPTLVRRGRGRAVA